jgi:predicted dehydrogenase
MKAIQEGREPFVNGEEGRKAMEIIAAIYQSSRTGKEIQFPLQS